MPPVKTAKTKKRQGKRRKAVARRQGRDKSQDYAYIVEDDHTTHVLVPLEEFERLREAAEVRELVTELQDPSVEWVDADEFALQLAGNRIAAARKAKGLTQRQLGEQLGLPQSQISRIERNPDSTTVRTLKRIARALRVNIAALVS